MVSTKVTKAMRRGKFFTIILRNYRRQRTLSSNTQIENRLVGIKNDAEKCRVELLPSTPLVMIGDVLTFGAKKYAAHNWRGGFDYSRLIGANLRHLLAFNDGEDLDLESGISHMAHAGCCTLFLLEQIAKGTGNDDRYKG